MKSITIGLFLAGLFFIAGCSSQKPADPTQRIQPGPDVRAADRIEDSFVVKPLKVKLSSTSTGDISVGKEDNQNLILKKSALDKEFLLAGSLIRQDIAALGNGLKSKVVAFKRYGKRVFLMEATQGHVVTDDLPSDFILTEFPVVREDEETLELDFNAGMSQVFVARNWYVSDMAEAATSSWATAPLRHSFVKSVGVSDNTLEIRQVAQLQAEAVSPTFEIRYFISPYLPNPDYQPKETRGDFRHVGFFEVAPVLEKNSGRSTVRMIKFHLSQPITLSISANTPPEFVDAVKEGILYWNSAFGQDIVRAEMAPVGVTAPDVRHNVVQWVPFDQAGGAYADFLMDPRSGQILHSQVYMQSVFAFASRQRAIQLLRQLRAEKAREKENAIAPLQLGVRFLDFNQLCDIDFSKQLMTALESALEQNVDDAKWKEISRHYVRSIIAHEIGHTLGLRHNFAGSLGSELTREQRDEAFAQMVQNEVRPTPDSPIVATTVMDYLNFKDEVLTGAKILNLQTGDKRALPYDRQAIQWGYFGAELDKSILFCTDTQVGVYADCNRGDAGAKPLVDQLYDLKNIPKSTVIEAVQRYITALAPYDPRDRRPIEEVNLLGGLSLDTALQNWTQPSLWLKKEARSLRVERNYPVINLINEEEVRKEKDRLAMDQIQEAGGLGFLFSLLPNATESQVSLLKGAKEFLAHYLQQPSVRDPVGGDGKPIHLTDEQLNFIQRSVEKYLDYSNDAFLESILEVLVLVKWDQTDLSEEIEVRLSEMARAVILSTVESSDRLSSFRYKQALRVNAAKMIAADRGYRLDWGYEGRQAIKKELQTLVEGRLGKKLDKIKPETLTRAQRLWFLEQQAVLSLL